jgi:hypothetical protein
MPSTSSKAFQTKVINISSASHTCKVSRMHCIACHMTYIPADDMPASSFYMLCLLCVKDHHAFPGTQQPIHVTYRIRHLCKLPVAQLTSHEAHHIAQNVAAAVKESASGTHQALLQLVYINSNTVECDYASRAHAPCTRSTRGTRERLAWQ